MHGLNNPVSRILSLAILTILVNRQDWTGMAIFLLPLFFLLLRYPQQGFRILNLASRLRWFFISISVLYLWFYPGVDLFPQLGVFSPTREGAEQATIRITGLLIIIAYSGFLVFLTPRDELISGIQGVLSPLHYAGLDTSRFALRLVLVLDVLSEIRLSGKTQNQKKASSVIGQLAKLFAAAEKAELEPDRYAPVAIAKLPAPRFLDLFIPFILIIWLVTTTY